MQKVNLNLIPGGVRPVVNVSQYDEGRQFQLAIFQGSASYDLTGKTVTIEVGKTDGNGCAYGVTDLVNGVPVVAVSGNLVTITTPRQMTACSGENIAELKIAASGNEIGTLNFVLLCEQSALSPDTPISETEIPAIIAGAEEAASHYPYIDDTTKNWYVWSVAQGAFVDTGVRAEGIDGEGSVQSVNNIAPDVNGNVSLPLATGFSDILPTANGGTGNADGFIRTGSRSGTTPGTAATAEGEDNKASGDYTHVEGKGNEATYPMAHAEGFATHATGPYSHAEGSATRASGSSSHAGGTGTVAGYSNQTVVGKYNKNESDSLVEVGNGYVDGGGTSHLSNAIAVKDDGRITKGSADAFVSGSNLDAVVELTRTMTAQRDAGTYVFVVADQKTYYIDTTIGSSGTLTPGTNATEATVFEKVRELTSDLTNKIKDNSQGGNEYGDFVFTSDSGSWLRLLVGKLNATTNYVQFFIDNVDYGYIAFTVSRNIPS